MKETKKTGSKACPFGKMGLCSMFHVKHAGAAPASAGTVYGFLPGEPEDIPHGPKFFETIFPKLVL